MLLLIEKWMNQNDKDVIFMKTSQIILPNENELKRFNEK